MFEIVCNEGAQGETTGCIRFSTEEAATKAISSGTPPGTAQVKDKTVKLVILQGSEEIAYHQRVRDLLLNLLEHVKDHVSVLHVPVRWSLALTDRVTWGLIS